jgi:glucosyl-3-phosphoglycerate phosphatase
MSKLVHLIRHAQSTFNLHYAATGIDPMHRDARLTDLGLSQVAEARETARALAVEAVYVTPLTRALQTAHGLFGSSVTIHIEPLHREHLFASCDVGRPPSELAAEFPQFSFDHLPDVWWHDGPEDERGIPVEPEEVFLARVESFRSWVRSLPQRRVAIVGHGTFLHAVTGKRFNNCEIYEWEPT